MNKYISQISCFIVLFAYFMLCPFETTFASSGKRQGLYLSAGLDVGTSIFERDDYYALSPSIGFSNFKVGYYSTEKINFFWSNRLMLNGMYIHNIERNVTYRSDTYVNVISALGVIYYPLDKQYSFLFSYGLAITNYDDAYIPTMSIGFQYEVTPYSILGLSLDIYNYNTDEDYWWWDLPPVGTVSLVYNFIIY